MITLQEKQGKPRGYGVGRTDRASLQVYKNDIYKIKIRTMKKILSAIVLLSAAVSVYADDAKEEKNDSTGGFVFTDVKVLKTTPVKDQNKSGTCWCFAGTSFLRMKSCAKGARNLTFRRCIPCASAILTRPRIMCE